MNRTLGILLLILFSITAGAQKDQPSQAAVEERNKAIAEQNKGIEEANAAVASAFKAGNAALAARDFDAAIAAYDKAITRYPWPAGTHTLLTNKSAALDLRASERFNAASRSTDPAAKKAGLAAAGADWRLAAEEASNAVAMAKTLPHNEGDLVNALRARARAIRMVAAKVDGKQAVAALAAFREYEAKEPNRDDRMKAQREVARMLFDTGETDRSIAEFEAILAVDPKDLEAYFYAGSALVATNDKNLHQKGANYLKRFLDLAPANDTRREDATAFLDYLKTSEAIVPKN